MHASPSPASAGLFRPGDRWLAVGDSITQHAGYQAAILLYHATRFPGRSLEPANAGIVGDSAGGALTRYDWDIAPRRPGVATVMFGMNDVGQELYGPEIASPELREKRRAALADYEKNILRLTERLRADGARVILLSPTPFDETAQNERPSRPGINAALAECGAILRRLACEHGHAFVDLHGPLTALNTRLQAANPAATIVGPDRIHPGPAGHLLMACHILKARGAPDLVSRVDLDAAAGRVLAAETAGVSGLSASPGELAFTVDAHALPYPVSPDAGAAAVWVPFHDDLNREILRVTGLAPGLHALHIDDIEIRRYSADELAAGVNLALETTTPQMRQAAAIGELVAQWRELLSLNLRRIALVEYWHLRELPRPVDFAAARRVLAGKLASTPDMDAYTRTCLEAYLAIKPVEAATRRKLDELLARLRTECRPRPRVYRLVRI